MMTLEWEHVQDEMPFVWEEISEAESENSLFHLDGMHPTTTWNVMLHAIQTNVLVNLNALIFGVCT